MSLDFPLLSLIDRLIAIPHGRPLHGGFCLREAEAMRPRASRKGWPAAHAHILLSEEGARQPSRTGSRSDVARRPSRCWPDLEGLAEPRLIIRVTSCSLFVNLSYVNLAPSHPVSETVRSRPAPAARKALSGRPDAQL